MKIIDVINHRFSVRRFKKLPIERKKLMQVLDSGRLAPSAVNFQPWFFIAVQKEENLKNIYTIYNRDWIKEAPAVIIACVDHSRSWKRSSDRKDFGDVDIAIAIDHMTLQATELNLGTCWVCNFNAELCGKLFNLPSHIEPVALLPIGYPDILPPIKKRKPLDEIVRWETF